MIFVTLRYAGHGKSGAGSGISKGTFVMTLVEELVSQVPALVHLSQPVLVSPSMSGQYSVPVLLAEANKPRGTPAAIAGFVAVAPANTALLQEEAASRVQVRYETTRF